MDPIRGIVVIAGLTTVGKPTGEVLKGAIEKIIGPSAEALGQGIAVPIQAWAKRRAELAFGTLQSAAELLEAAHVEPTRVPGRVLWPILEHSSLEEDDDLRRQWAMLLANAATSPESVSPAFAKLLSEMSPRDARILQFVFQRHVATGNTTSLPWQEIVAGATPEGVLLADSDILIASMFNLTRLQLLMTTAHQTYLLQTHEQLLRLELQLTRFGLTFARAVNELSVPA